MGADDDVDRAVGDALLGRAPAPSAPTRREAWPISTGRPRKRSREGLEVLAREQRRRHDDRHLLAVHRGDEGGAQRHLGLAEADIAADQPVHRPAGARSSSDGVDRRHAGRRSPRRGSARRIRRRGRRAASAPARRASAARRRCLISCAAMSRMRFFSRALRDLPGDAAELVEHRPRRPPRRSGQKLDVLDRQEEPVVAGIEELQAVVRRAGRLDGLQAR